VPAFSRPAPLVEERPGVRDLAWSEELTSCRAI
jgi:hypothetical protein